MNALTLQAKSDGVPFINIGFACNQFLYQMPGDNRTEILNAAKYVRPAQGFEPNFPWFGMMDVNGRFEWPLYTFLKNVCPPYQKALNIKANLEYDPIASGDVTWNFEKYLISPQGIPLMRFSPTILVSQIYEEYIYPNAGQY